MDGEGGCCRLLGIDAVHIPGDDAPHLAGRLVDLGHDREDLVGDEHRGAVNAEAPDREVPLSPHTLTLCVRPEGGLRVLAHHAVAHHAVDLRAVRLSDLACLCPFLTTSNHH